MKLNHKELVLRAVRWLHGTMKCPVVLYEIAAGYEIPDAIGWRRAGYESLLVECKTSISDFKKDFDKPHRKGPGIGNLRYYFTPAKLLKIEDIPAGWGLAEFGGYHVKIVKKPDQVFIKTMHSESQEKHMLYSAMMRQSSNIHNINNFINTVWPLRGEAGPGFSGGFPIYGDDDFEYHAIIGSTLAVATDLASKKGYVVTVVEDVDQKMESLILNRLRVTVVNDIITGVNRG